MRSREEIEKDIEKTISDKRGLWGTISPQMGMVITNIAVVELLLDIRDLLEKAVQPQAPEPVYGMREDDEPAPKKDELFDKAVGAIMAKAGNHPINATFLRTALNICYGRASKLIDQLEAAGVISAPDPITHRRKLV